MRRLFKTLAGLAITAALIGPMAAKADDAALGAGMTVYMQMGGNPGDTATLARELGARAAAKSMGVKLVEQHAGWNPQTMITQANEALAAAPDAIIVMGHPGSSAMTPFLAKAKEANVVVVDNNNALPGTDVS